MSAVAWLVIVLAGIALWTVNDTRQYRRFRQEGDTDARRAFYWRWTVQSFVVLTGASAVTLGLLGRFDALFEMPAEFAALAPASRLAAAPATDSADARLGMLVGFALATLAAIVIWTRRVKSMASPVIAELEPLIPRNGAERLAALPLCLNAGYAEELFFRLALPLLLTTVTGSAAVGTGVAMLVFGLIHWYQGWKGIVATTLAGGVLTLVYVTSGSLLRVMVTHAMIDVLGLIVRPMIGERFVRRAVKAVP